MEKTYKTPENLINYISLRAGASVLQILILSILIFAFGCIPKEISVATEAKEKNPAFEFAKAERLYQKKRYDKALAAYETFARSYPDDINSPTAYLRKGQILLKQKKYARARKELEEFLLLFHNHKQEAQALQLIGTCYYNLQNYQLTLNTLKNLLNKYPRRKSVELYFMIAKSFQQLNDYNNSFVYFKLIKEEYPSSNLSPEVTYGFALAAFYQKKYQLAWDNLYRINDDLLTPTEKLNIKLMLGNIANLKGHYWLAWEKLIAVRQDLPADNIDRIIFSKKEIEDMIKELIGERFNYEQLSAVKKRYAHKFPAGEAILKLVRMTIKQNDYSQAESLLEDFFEDFPQHSRYMEATELMEKVKNISMIKMSNIGLIIPLTGRFSVFGNMVLKGVQFAIEQENIRREIKLSLVVKDSKGKPYLAAKAMQELTEQNKVIGVIGPVLSKSAKVAAKWANQLQTPMLSPTASAKGIPELGDYVFRNCITSAQQVKTIIQFSIEKMCKKEFAVLYPKNSYGREFKDIFIPSVAELGGNLLGVANYEDGETDFRAQANYLNELEPEVIFIPDYADKVALIVPQLSFYTSNELPEELNPDVLLDEGESKREKEELQQRLQAELKQETGSEWWMQGGSGSGLPPAIIPIKRTPWEQDIIKPEKKDKNRFPKIVLLGTNGWHSPQLIKEGSNFIEEAIFPIGFYDGSPDPLVQNFITEFNDYYWEKPNLLAAQAYDAAQIFIQALNQNPVSREEFREYLLDIKDFPGVSGETNFTENGDSQKKLFIMGIKNKKFMQLSGEEAWLCPDKSDLTSFN